MRYNIPPPPSPPQEQSIARSLLLHADRACLERIKEHEARFNDFWNSSVPPHTIAASLGSNGVRFLFDAAESVRHITVLICGPEYLSLTEEERAERLHAYLPPEKYVPRLPLIPNPQDGTVTVQSVDGLDDWGRPLPEVVEPEPEVLDDTEE